jgi:nitric oxide reductase NorQ protein
MGSTSRPRPKPVTCPTCGTVFQDRRGFVAYQQHSNCWKPVREAPLQQVLQRTPAAIPERDPNWYVSPELARCFSRWDAAAKRGVALAVALVGPPGWGKTTATKEFAARTGRPYLEVSASLWQEAGGALGRWLLQGGDTRFVPASWLTFLEQVPNGVLLLDEINRVQDLRALNVLLPLLDHRAAAFVEELGRTVRRAAGTVVLATMNRNPDDHALSLLPEALRTRADFVCLAPLPADVEALILVSRAAVSSDKAERIVKLANSLRQAPPDHRVPISLRQTLRLADEVAADRSLSLLEAARTTIAHAFDQDDEGTLAGQILQAAQMCDWHRPGKSR